MSLKNQKIEIKTGSLPGSLSILFKRKTYDNVINLGI